MNKALLVAVPAAALIGVLALLLAHDARSWRNTLRDDSAEYSVSPGERLRLTAPSLLPSSVSGLLSVDRDRDWLRALKKFSAAYRSTINLRPRPAAYRARTAAGRSRQGHRDPDPARASQAYNLLAVLTAREAFGTGIVHGLMQEALTDLQNAVRLDPTDEEAKANIEIVLRALVVIIPPEQKQTRGAGNRAHNAPKGGYAGPPGRGY